MATPIDRVRETLGFTESRNRYDADNGLGYTGKYQFGRDRLTDLGLGQSFTMEQYNKDPQLQEELFNRHIAQIDGFINQNGLDKYVGTEINGVPLTREGMYAIAHLGGNGGLQKYVTTGGKYNPSDAFGTRLSDYAATHGGGPRMNLTEGGDPARSEGRRPSRLTAFADEMKQGSGMAGEMLVSALAPSLTPENRQVQGPNRPQQGMTLPNAGLNGLPQPSQSLGFGPNIGKVAPDPFVGQAQLSFGGAPVPQPGVAGAPGNFAGQPGGGGFGITPTPATAVVPAPRVSTSGGPAGPSGPVATEGGEEEAAPGLMQRIAEFFYPNREDPEGKFRESLGALGVGLGQMSTGQTVDLQPYFNNIASQRQAMLDSVGDNYELQLQADRLLLDQERLRLDQVKQGAETARFNMENTPGGGMFTEEQLMQYSLDPVTEPFVAMLQSPVKEAREEGLAGLRSVIADRAKNNTQEPGYGALIDAVGRDAPIEEIARIVTDSGLDPSKVKQVFDMLGKSPTALQQNSEAYLEAKRTDPELARTMEEVALRNMGVDETAEQKRDRETYTTYSDQLNERANANRNMDGVLASMRTTTERMIEEGEETGPFNAIFTQLGNSVRQAFGADAAGKLAEISGVNFSNYESLETAEKTLALLIAQPLMEGGGAISDGERAAMLQTVANGGTTAEQRLQMIDKLTALNKIDAILAREYDASVPENYEGARTTYHNLQRQATSALPEIVTAAEGAVAAAYAGKLPGFSYMNDYDTEQWWDAVAPELTAEQYQLFNEVISPLELDDGSMTKIWTRINPDGSRTKMENNAEWKP